VDIKIDFDTPLPSQSQIRPFIFPNKGTEDKPPVEEIDILKEDLIKFNISLNGDLSTDGYDYLVSQLSKEFFPKMVELQLITRIALTLRIQSPGELINFQNTALGFLYARFCSFHRIRAYVNYIPFEMLFKEETESKREGNEFFSETRFLR